MERMLALGEEKQKQNGEIVKTGFSPCVAFLQFLHALKKKKLKKE